ncbi:MAG: SIS domain-containing protein [Flavobacteriales bacterium]|nr:SIS domain-containing protein [Flavobacteriales bacterium]
MVELEFLVKNLEPDIKFILLTGKPGSELASKADVTLYTGGPEEICPLGLAPTTSTTVMTVAGDILVVLLMEKIGFTKAEYAKRHHSGYLGQKAKE